MVRLVVQERPEGGQLGWGQWLGGGLLSSAGGGHGGMGPHLMFLQSLPSCYPDPFPFWGNKKSVSKFLGLREESQFGVVGVGEESSAFSQRSWSHLLLVSLGSVQGPASGP